MRYEYRAVSNDPSAEEHEVFGQPRDTLARAEADARRMKVASTQSNSRIQVRGIDDEREMTGAWSFVTEGGSS